MGYIIHSESLNAQMVESDGIVDDDDDDDHDDGDVNNSRFTNR